MASSPTSPGAIPLAASRCSTPENRRSNLALAPRRHSSGFEVELPRQVGEDEEQIAHLIRQPGRVGRWQLGAQFRSFLLQLVEDAGGIRPVEADPGGAPGQLVGPHQRWQAGGDAGQRAGLGPGGALGGLLHLPGCVLGGGVAGRCVAEDMRVTETIFL